MQSHIRELSGTTWKQRFDIFFSSIPILLAVAPTQSPAGKCSKYKEFQLQQGFCSLAKLSNLKLVTSFPTTDEQLAVLRTVWAEGQNTNAVRRLNCSTSLKLATLCCTESRRKPAEQFLPWLEDYSHQDYQADSFKDTELLFLLFGSLCFTLSCSVAQGPHVFC